MNIKTLDEFMYKVPGYGRIRYFFEKRIKGFTNYEIGDLDVLTSQFLVPRLKAFKKETYAYPCDLTKEQWDEILEDMIYFHTKSAAGDHPFPSEPDVRYEAGKEAFFKYYNALWW
jgi:hypothetical protein